MCKPILSQSDQTVNQNLTEVAKKKRKKYDQKDYCRIRPQYLHFEPEEGVSGFTLSKAVTEIPTSYFSAADGASPEIQRRVLRVLCDRYPDIYASVRNHAEKANLSIRSTQRGLRALERIGMISCVEVPGDCGWSPRQYRIDTRKVLEASSPKMLRRVRVSPQGCQGVAIVTTGSRDSHDRESCYLRQGGIQTDNAEEKKRENEIITSTTAAPLAPQNGGTDDDVIDPFELIKIALGGAAATGSAVTSEPVATGAYKATPVSTVKTKSRIKKSKEENPAAKFDEGRFIADITSILSVHTNGPMCPSTAKHRQAVIDLAYKHGPETVLRAADLWTWGILTHNGPIFVGTDKQGKPIYKTWLLDEFVKSGAASRLIQKVAPYAGIELEKRVIKLVVDCEIQPEALTPARKDAVEWLEEECWGCDYLKDVLSQAGLYEIKDKEAERRFLDILIDVQGPYEQAAKQDAMGFAKRKGTPSAMETARSMVESIDKHSLEFQQEYAPFRQRLIEEKLAMECLEPAPAPAAEPMAA